MRSNQNMTWVKFYVTGWLHGSIRYQLEPDERGVWADLIVLAGQCLGGGRICDNGGTAYPRQYIANQLNIPLKLLERTIEKCKQEGRIQEGDDGILIITHWGVYQSEYERQKKYRKKRDIRKSPNETEKEFRERLELFAASQEPPEDKAEYMRKSDELVRKATTARTFIDKGANF